MEIAGIFMLLIQIGFAVHAMRHGQSFLWVFLIIFLPLLGCILYSVMVLLPEIIQSRTARQGSKALLKTLDPQKELRKRREALEMSDTVGNRSALAQEYLKHGMLDDAIELYGRSLTGMYRTDPNLLLGLAKALVETKNFERARETLETLFEANPDFENQEAHLLYARSLEALGEMDRALDEYRALAKYSAGAEAKCRHALLLKRMGKTSEARALFEEILKDAKVASRHSYRLNKEWVDIAKREVS
ncbi:tetratricopeptide repeat protein [Methylocaldum sp.]|uniref:tetratricopeptide repeat protein n=1 Tax=Methylocaldum sp. TaxID=1969727 RepID=UPI002D315E84|nr:tetratricopeptide repeat protein [Methylocaldum sp.]HYE36734.1 tetratricopeptide repeat protein [Methylocaldum sp.]